MIILIVTPIYFMLLRCRAIELPPTYKPTHPNTPWKITVENVTIHPKGPDILPRTCGVARTHSELRSAASIEAYPWLGVLHYPVGTTRVTTSVVLISRRLVIGSALEIYKMPKNYFRKLARVVIGRNCSSGGLRVSEYNYHPEFRRRSYSALVLIQLDLYDNFDRRELQPICGPPKKLVESRLYAMILSENCRKAKIRTYEMDVVSPKECKEFYKKAELDIATIWPVNSVCAQSKMERSCVWRDGAVLAVKQNGVWHLMGFGVNGPGCGSPSRFLDYTVYERWVRQSVARTAIPAITRLHHNHLLLRTSMNIQRFGPCDPEEMSLQIFTETKFINSTSSPSWSDNQRTPEVVKYNLTLFTTIDYTCVIFLATYPKTLKTTDKPKIDLKTYATVQRPIYHDPSQRLHFYVEIQFVDVVVFKVTAYGRERRVLEHKAALKRINQKKRKPPIPWDLKVKKKN